MTKDKLRKDNPELFMQIRNEGVEIGKQHAQPSGETKAFIERHNKMAIDLARWMERVDNKLQEIVEQTKKTNGQVIKNTEHRLKLESALATYKWLFGFLGIGNIVSLLKIFNII